MSEKRQLPVGMFDSGVGGLTVLQQMMRLLPKESVVYYGDTARLPYGNKSPSTVIRYSIENSVFLMEQGIKVLVIACNTATSHAAQKLRQVFNIPIIDVIQPGAERAAAVTKSGKIALIGTRGTVNSGAYQREILRHLPKASITALACPLFVPLVEEQFLSHQATRMVVREYLAPLKTQNVDTLLLGCTHYPLLRVLIEEEMEGKVTIVDPAITCAEKVADLLNTSGLSTTSSKPQYRYYVSDDPEKFRVLGKDFLGMPVDHVELASSSYSI